MKIASISIDGLGGIEHLSLIFHRHMNIICGPNGIGKSTVLDAIAHCFLTGETSILKRNARAKEGKISSRVEIGRENKTIDYRVSDFTPQTNANFTSDHLNSKYIILFRVNRTFSYRALNAVARDELKPAHQLWNELRSGVTLDDTKNWFVNRFLYSKHKGSLTPTQLKNFNTAKRAFSVLDSDFSFLRVDASSNEIMIQSPGGNIYYEYLSSGFKSCLSIIFAIIKEVEYRFAEEHLSSEEFSGVVLIDEIELHLHPIWQSKVTSILSSIFPKVQFIVTTHSPHVIQAAEPDQIIALERKDGTAYQRELPTSPYGFKNWTLDEVLMDVMGMEDTRSEEFNRLVERFGKAIDRGARAEAKAAFKQLDISLHPNNHMRKLFRLQLATILEPK